MSLYNNYEKASNNYDLGRYPSGAEIQIGMLQGYLKRPLQDVSANFVTLYKIWLLFQSL